jgi:hypothetical protein
MAESKTKMITEAFGMVILAVILIPIANQLASDSNLTGATKTIVTLLPLLVAVIVILAMFKDHF